MVLYLRPKISSQGAPKVPETDVLIIGSGVAGSYAAMELAQSDISVTLITDATEVCDTGWGPSDLLPTGEVHYMGDVLSCPRATQQLEQHSSGVADELQHNESGNRRAQLLFSLRKKVAELPHIQQLSGYSVIELITLAKHSCNAADVYKKPTCLGAYLLNHASGELEEWRAKETILATGGSAELFLNHSSAQDSRGSGISLAERAGARLLHLNHIHFHPFTLPLTGRTRYSLPAQFWAAGAQLSCEGKTVLTFNQQDPQALTELMVREQLLTGVKTLELHLSEESLTQFPNLCADVSIDSLGDTVSVIPAAHYCCGGVAVDRCGQSSVSRLRAIGQVSCTGVHGKRVAPALPILESVVWARSCAADVTRTVQKFAHYSPPIRELSQGTRSIDQGLIQQDWAHIQHTLWNYVGVQRDKRRLYRALDMLNERQRQNETFYSKAQLSADIIQLKHGLHTARLITEHAITQELCS